MQLPFLGIKPRAAIPPHPILKPPDLKALQLCIPENASGYVQDWFENNPVHVRIAGARSSKSGDYRAQRKYDPASISVNRTLNIYNFLITLVHEMAHHEVWNDAISKDRYSSFRRKNRFPKPHGAEWKIKYRTLMEPLMTDSVFPANVLAGLTRYFEDPRSSVQKDKQLVLALMGYDLPDDSVMIASLPFDAEFYLPAGRKFRKKEKLRKRFRCECLNNGRIYLFSPMARVIPSLKR